MRITINDKQVIIPSSLSEITLGQRIDFHNQYGRELDDMLASIQKMEDDIEKELELSQFAIEKMFRTVAFFSGFSVEALKESVFIEAISNIYYSALAVLFEEEENLEFKKDFIWNGEEWELGPIELKHGSDKTFGEFIDSKQLVQDMADLGRGKWESMLSLAAIFFRKKGEEYREEFLFEDSERLKLMRELPMDIVMQIGFFLAATVNIYYNTFRYSLSQELKPAAGISKIISTNGVGSTS